MKTRVSRVMSTQHPDNVTPPFFSNSKILHGDTEIKEAFYAFSHLGAEEQLWDCEGKEVDNFVVKKLLSRYEDFFRKKKLGRDLFITLRTPNPSIEKNEAKILLETLESIPRSRDIAKLFYGDDISPIFEVCQPMTSSSQELLRISRYYKKFVAGKNNEPIPGNGMTVAEWVGELRPDSIRVTPLIEDKKSMLDSHNIAREYIQEEKPEDYQRVWLARSDPALNYGNLGAVMIEKVALQRLHELEEELSIDILPILGCGTAPFRGNLRPDNVKSMLRGYPSVHTFTVQSAFKYDYEERQVVKGIDELNGSSRKEPIAVDENKCIEILEKTSEEYQKQVKVLAGMINSFTAFVPKRRKRKLHIGLFGYSRATAGIKLPRAIAFCASLYSIGLPPEILGLHALSREELDYVSEAYPSFLQDMRDSLRFLNEENLEKLPQEAVKGIRKALRMFDYDVDEGHQKLSASILNGFSKRNTENLEDQICMAGKIRGFLG